MNQQPYVLFNQGIISSKKPYDPFIYTDLLAEYAGLNQQPIIHLWQMKEHVILGMQDTRLPHFDAAVHSLNQADYHTVIRNSGGLAVVSDDGILNLSLIYPSNTDLTIEKGYQQMTDFITSLLPIDPTAIQAGEIRHSYCPGEFDLAINQKKFAGIAQRRVKQGTAVMIYLSLNGQQKKRTEMIKHFYQAGLKEDFGKPPYPAVDPNCMATLSDLLNITLTSDAFIEQLINQLADQQQLIMNDPFATWLTSLEFEQKYHVLHKRMEQRNQLLQSSVPPTKGGDLNAL